MARRTRILTPVVVSLAVAFPVLANEVPVAASPGAASRLVEIGDPCPTFNWAAVPGAESYELFVYRIGEEGEESVPVLRQKVKGAVTGWTPSLDRCLERGREYAWSVRAVAKEVPSEWSSPTLFEVAGRPSEMEFERALEVVRSYLESEDEAEADPEFSASDSLESAATPLELLVGRSAAVEGESVPVPAALTNVQLAVEGDVMAEKFGGEGSNLTGVTASAVVEVVPIWVSIQDGTPMPTLQQICNLAKEPGVTTFTKSQPIAVSCDNTQEASEWPMPAGLSETRECATPSVISPINDAICAYSTTNPQGGLRANVPFTNYCDLVAGTTTYDGIVFCLVAN